METNKQYKIFCNWGFGILYCKFYLGVLNCLRLLVNASNIFLRATISPASSPINTFPYYAISLRKMSLFPLDFKPNLFQHLSYKPSVAPESAISEGLNSENFLWSTPRSSVLHMIISFPSITKKILDEFLFIF